jgi:hypothetical protein
MYVPYVWSDSSDLSAENFNHLETQYSEMKALIDAPGHIYMHDTRYYEQATADITFYSPTYMGDVALVNTSKLDDLTQSQLIQASMPIGAIMAWNATSDPVPNNWQICDGKRYGSVTTPNLIGKFVVGSGLAFASDTVGGSMVLTPTATTYLDYMALTINQIPAHQHLFHDKYASGALSGFVKEGTTSAASTDLIWDAAENTSSPDAGYNGTHGHDGSTVTISQIDKRPPWYSLYFIMKVS